MKLRVILTGATGMVGEGVLHECLNHPDVETVLVLGRRASGLSHPKMKEILHNDFFNITPIAEQLRGYNTCLFCSGVSSVGMMEEEFYRLTYTLTLHVAGVLANNNPGMMFCYISGSATDSTEKGRVMWARVKGKTENDLMKLPFKSVYNFRPGFMKPTPGLKNTLPYYKYILWLYPVLRKVFPNFVSTLAELGQAMIKTCLNGDKSHIVEVGEIKSLNHD